MVEKNYLLTLSASAGTIQLLRQMFVDLVAGLGDLEEMAASEAGLQLPESIELEGDAEYIRGLLTHQAIDEAVEPLGLGLEDDDPLVAGFVEIRRIVAAYYLDSQRRMRNRPGPLTRKQHKAASDADKALNQIGSKLGLVVEEDAPVAEKALAL